MLGLQLELGVRVSRVREINVLVNYCTLFWQLIA